MEIHAPEGPIHSFRDFSLQLLTVTVGILIALSLEGLLEWQHHRELVHEARTNIVSEIRDNQKELHGSMSSFEEAKKQHLKVLRFISDVLTHGKSDIRELKINYNLATLSDSSWKTAEAVGALALMPYAEVKKYANVYALQTEYLRLQTKRVDSEITALAMFAENKDPNTLPHAELEKERADIQSALAQTTAQSQIGTGLEKTYAEVLEHHQPE